MLCELVPQVQVPPLRPLTPEEGVFTDTVVGVTFWLPSWSPAAPQASSHYWPTTQMNVSAPYLIFSGATPAAVLGCLIQLLKG